MCAETVPGPSRGFDGVSIYSKIGTASNVVGNLMTEILVERGEETGFIKSCLRAATGDNESSCNARLTGFP